MLKLIKREGVKKVKTLHQVSYLLLWVGAINWGLVGLLDLNLVMKLLGSAPGLEKLVYVLVGVAGVYTLATHKEYCKYCASGK